jgi:nucleoside-diphosphate-sugar epimerase
MNESYGADEAAWRGRRVLVLGASGFIGRRVALLARRLGCEVHAAADLRAERDVAELLARVRPDVVLDLAGYGVGREEQDAEIAELVNARLPAWVVRAFSPDRGSEWPGARIVHAGSSAENRPTTLYGRTKLAGTRALTGAATETGVRALTARLFHVYGPGERPSRLFPSLVRAAREGGDLALTSGTQAHDFAFVDDVAESLMRLARSSARPGEIVDVATGRLTTVREFALIAARVLGLPADRLRFGEPAAEASYGPARLSRLLELCGEAPSPDLERGILRAVRELPCELAS